jgi:HEPN domain-containing protein
LTNFERAEKLLREAEALIEEVARAYENRMWNLVIRRSQEMVELVLKALLKAMGIEYPKVHDVGPVFVDVLKEKGLKVEESWLNQIKEISAYLARERIPAFYMEKDYSQQQAEKAKDDSLKILEFGREFVKKLF